jgi:hypothetical protein
MGEMVKAVLRDHDHRGQANSRIWFIERTALGTAKAEEGRMKADGRALDQADVFRSLPDRGFEAGEAGRAGLTRIRRPASRPFGGSGGFGEVASGMILG